MVSSVLGSIKRYIRVLCNFNYVFFDINIVKEKSAKWRFCRCFEDVYFIFQLVIEC